MLQSVNSVHYSSHNSITQLVFTQISKKRDNFIFRVKYITTFIPICLTLKKNTELSLKAPSNIDSYMLPTNSENSNLSKGLSMACCCTFLSNIHFNLVHLETNYRHIDIEVM